MMINSRVSVMSVLGSRVLLSLKRKRRSRRSRALGRVEGPDRLGLELRLVVGGLLEPRLEAGQALLGVVVLRARAVEVGPDQVEVLPELPEVLLEGGAVLHDLLGPLLDLHAAQAEDDHLEVGGERRGRDGE